MDRPTQSEEQALQRAVVRVHAQGWGIAFGALFGVGLFIATNILVLKGGDVVGPHLGLLGAYFPGYRVTGLGSVVGLVYGFVVGYAFGRTIAALYNALVSRLG